MHYFLHMLNGFPKAAKEKASKIHLYLAIKEICEFFVCFDMKHQAPQNDITEFAEL